MTETTDSYITKSERNVKSIWAHYQGRLGSKVFPKRSRVLMRIAARVVARRTETTEEEFLGDFVTTIGRRIYVPFELGVEKPGWLFRDQMLLAVHEHQHVVQWLKEPVRFLTKYARDTRKRALFEAEAFRSEFEACNAFGWSPPNLEQRLGTLAGYGVTAADVGAARSYLALHVSEQGHPGPRADWTKAGTLALRWTTGD